VLTLPGGTKPEDVTAAYADGVLTVSMPAATPSAPQEVPVTHGDLPVG
jgi:HSP20 family molecular chaperone IbpA